MPVQRFKPSTLNPTLLASRIFEEVQDENLVVCHVKLCYGFLVFVGFGGLIRAPCCRNTDCSCEADLKIPVSLEIITLNGSLL